jgi:hypothetical protein
MQYNILFMSLEHLQRSVQHLGFKLLYGTSAMQDWSEDHQLLVVHCGRRAETM